MGARCSLWKELIRRQKIRTRDQKELNEIYIQLSSNNRERVLTYSKSLLSTQQLDDELLAAHVRTDIEDSPENQQRDLDLMDDDQ